MLAEHRPIILTNAIARLDGLEYCGEFNKNGELIKAETAGKIGQGAPIDQ